MWAKVQAWTRYLGAVTLVAVPFVPAWGGLTETAARVAMIALVMALWWVTEALPLSVTALVPLAIMPMSGAGDLTKTASAYAHPLIFLFMGGFLLARAMEKWNLHKRIALHILALLGTRADRLVLGFLLATALISMWVSNSATAMMMLPIGLSVLKLVEHETGTETRNFRIALLLAIAFGASVGGLGSLIGSPPNALLAAYLAKTGTGEIGFLDWMSFGVPFMLILLPITWFILVKLLFPMGKLVITDGAEFVAKEARQLGPLSRAEVQVAAVFTLAVSFWISAPFLNKAFGTTFFNDTSVAVIAALLLFLMPVDRLNGTFILAGEDLRHIAWDVLILFGGGLALATGIESSGLATSLGESLHGLGSISPFLLAFIVVITMVALSELASNTAIAATFMSVLGAVGETQGYPPLYLTALGTLAASCSFALPVATPPNTIIFSSQHVRVRDMAKAGLLLDVAAVILLSTVMSVWLRYLGD